VDVYGLKAHSLCTVDPCMQLCIVREYYALQYINKKLLTSM